MFYTGEMFDIQHLFSIAKHVTDRMSGSVYRVGFNMYVTPQGPAAYVEIDAEADIMLSLDAIGGPWYKVENKVKTINFEEHWIKADQSATVRIEQKPVPFNI